MIYDWYTVRDPLIPRFVEKKLTGVECGLRFHYISSICVLVSESVFDAVQQMLRGRIIIDFGKHFVKCYYSWCSFCAVVKLMRWCDVTSGKKNSQIIGESPWLVTKNVINGKP